MGGLMRTFLCCLHEQVNSNDHILRGPVGSKFLIYELEAQHGRKYGGLARVITSMAINAQ